MVHARFVSILTTAMRGSPLFAPPGLAFVCHHVTIIVVPIVGIEWFDDNLCGGLLGDGRSVKVVD